MSVGDAGQEVEHVALLLPLTGAAFRPCEGSVKVAFRRPRWLPLLRLCVLLRCSLVDLGTAPPPPDGV